ncbi:MAG TPA: hypothetical protein VG298_02945 [Acidimicrobiales bacterium]|nr:hypothetical protein [Acidimicrobiales bacterium]
MQQNQNQHQQQRSTPAAKEGRFAMAMCAHCGGEMTEGVSCRTEPVSIDGRDYELIRWGEERKPKRYRFPDHCGDCNTPLGGTHHPGCCVEHCPVCRGQALGCGCFDEPADLDDSALEDRPPHPHPRCHDHLFRQQRQQ